MFQANYLSLFTSVFLPFLISSTLLLMSINGECFDTHQDQRKPYVLLNQSLSVYACFCLAHESDHHIERKREGLGVGEREREKGEKE